MEDRTSLDNLEAELAHSERLASIGQLAAGVAHEIGNPLTGIASIAQNLQHDAKACVPDIHLELDEQASDVLKQVDRINAIVRSDVEIPSSPIVTGDSNQLVQVFVNLIANACEASPSGGTVSIHALVDESQLAVTISDEGSGIDEDLRDRIFDPFFTTKPVGQGTGLGLSLVYSIVASPRPGSQGSNSPGPGSAEPGTPTPR